MTAFSDTSVASRLRGLMRLDALSSSVSTRWRALSPRERVLVALAMAIIAGALGWLALLRPALRVESAAPPRIEQLRVSLGRAQAQADELARLNAMPALAVPGGALDASVRRWMEQHGVQAKFTQLPGTLTVQVQGLPAWALAELARTARSQWASQVVSAQLRMDGGGALTGSLQLSADAASASSGQDGVATPPRP